MRLLFAIAINLYGLAEFTLHGAAEEKIISYKDAQGIESIIELTLIRESKVLVEKNCVLAFGSASLRIASFQGLSAAFVEAESVAVGRVADFINQGKLKPLPAFKLIGGRRLYESRQGRIVEVIWLYPTTAN